MYCTENWTRHKVQYRNALHTTQLHTCNAHSQLYKCIAHYTTIQLHCRHHNYTNALHSNIYTNALLPLYIPCTKGSWLEYRSQGTRSHNSTLNTEQSSHPCRVQQTILSGSVQLGVMGNSQTTCYSPSWIQPVPLTRNASWYIKETNFLVKKKTLQSPQVISYKFRKKHS